ncbi:MAG: hypothetical protein Q7S32_01655 [bacterium]|nr:hypothetical protein [bacterium]
MDYHIYFHGGCFDGTMSAALLRHFFISRGDRVASLNSCQYQPDFASIWSAYPFQHPSAIVDFRYHPDGDWWFDHHLTSFLKPEWQTSFNADGQHYFDPNYPSCFGMTLNFLKKTYQYKPSATLQELEVWADKIDGARYVSAKEAIEIDSWPQELALLLMHYDKIDPDGQEAFQLKVIDSVADESILQLLINHREMIDKLKERLRRAVELYKQAVKVGGKVAFLNKIDLEIFNADFIGYYLFPDVPYTVSIDKVEGGYHLHAGRNPWAKYNAQLNIGEMMKKYGGGGHLAVGGAEVVDLDQALKRIEEIVDYLNKHG